MTAAHIDMVIVNRTEDAADIYKACDIREFPINCMAVLEHYGLRAINIETLREKIYSTASCPTLCERANIEWMVHQKVCRSPWPLTPVEDCPDYPMPI